MHIYWYICVVWLTRWKNKKKKEEEEEEGRHLNSRDAYGERDDDDEDGVVRWLCGEKAAIL